MQFAHAAGIFLSSVDYFWPKYFLAIILKRQWAHKRKHLLQVSRFGPCEHKRGCQCTRLKFRQQQILLSWSSRTIPGREASVHLQCSRPWPRASLWPMWRCKATNPHLFLWRLGYATVQIKTLAPNTQGPSLSQIHPRGEFSTFPFSCREGQAWEGQVLLLVTRLNTLKEVKPQPLGCTKGTQQWPHLQWCPKPKWKNLVKTDYYICKFHLLFIKQAPKIDALTL